MNVGRRLLVTVGLMVIGCACASRADSIRIVGSTPTGLKEKLSEGPKPLTLQIEYSQQASSYARIEVLFQKSNGSTEYVIAGNISAKNTGAGTAIVSMPLSLFINPSSQTETASAAAQLDREARGVLPPGAYEQLEDAGLGGNPNADPTASGGTSQVEASESVEVVAKLMTYGGTLLSLAKSYYLIPKGGSITVTSTNLSSLDVASAAIGVSKVDPQADQDELLRISASMSGVGKVDVYLVFVMPNGSFYCLEEVGSGKVPDSFSAANEISPLAVDVPLDTIYLGDVSSVPGIYNFPIFEAPTKVFPAGTYGLHLILTQPGSNLSNEANWLASDMVKWRVWPNPGPELFLEFPAAGYTTTKETVEFIGLANDMDGVAGVIVNGQPAELIDLGSGDVNNAHMRVRWRVTLPFSYQENRSVTVSSYDALGNTTFNAVNANIRVIRPDYEDIESRSWPTISMLSPQAGRQYYIGDKVHLTGIVHDNDGIDEVFINDDVLKADGGNEGILPLSMGSPRNDPSQNPSSYPLQLWAVDSTVFRMYNVRTIGCEEGDMVRWSSVHQAFVPAQANSDQGSQVIGCVVDVREVVDSSGLPIEYSEFEDGQTRTNLGHADIIISGYIRRDVWKLESGTSFLTDANGKAVSTSPDDVDPVTGTFGVAVVAAGTSTCTLTGPATVALGQTATYTTDTLNTAGVTSLELSSSNPAVMSFNASGAATALSVGTTTITVRDTTAGSTVASASLVVTVLDIDKDASIITGTTPVEAGSLANFSASGVGGVTYTFTWASSPESIATISIAGVVRGVATGTATITATGTPSAVVSLGAQYYLHPTKPGALCTAVEFEALKLAGGPSKPVLVGVAVTPDTLAIGKAATIAWGEELYVGTIPTSSNSSTTDDVTILPTPMYDGFFQWDVELTEGERQEIRIGSRDLLGSYYHDVTTIWVRVLDAVNQDANSGNGDALTGSTTTE